MFSCEFCEISKNTFFKEQLRATTSNPSGDLLKVANYIDKYVLSMNQVVGLNALVEIYFDSDCNCVRPHCVNEDFDLKYDFWTTTAIK